MPKRALIRGGIAAATVACVAGLAATPEITKLRRISEEDRCHRERAESVTVE